MSVQIQGVGTIFRDSYRIGCAEYAADIQVVVDRPPDAPFSRYIVSSMFDGTIKLLNAPALRQGDGIEIELMCGRRYQLLVEEFPDPTGVQRVTGISVCLTPW
jgi:hypothetical protein